MTLMGTVDVLLELHMGREIGPDVMQALEWNLDQLLIPLGERHGIDDNKDGSKEDACKQSAERKHGCNK